MLVQRILASKKGATVVTIAPGTTVAAASGVLSEKKIGALIVSDDGEIPLGILSERDIVRALGTRGGGCLEETVDALMTRELVSCTASDSTDKVLGQMTDGRFRHMPVMDGPKMIGLISIGDVVKARLDELSMEKDALEGMIKGF